MTLEEQIDLTLLSHMLAKVDKAFALQVPDYIFSDSWGLFVTYEAERVEFYKKILFERTDYIETAIKYFMDYQTYKDQITKELYEEICKLTLELELLVNK